MDKRGYVVIRLMGGLGNQMFQYATGVAISEKFGRTLLIDTSLLGKTKDVTAHAVIRDFELSEMFEGPFRFASNRRIRQLYPLGPSLRSRLFSLWSRCWNAGSLFCQRGHDWIEVEDSHHETIGLVGRFQTERYFSDHFQEVFRAFRFRKVLSEEGSALVEKWSNSIDFVGVHVRRGDYVTHPVYSKTLGFVGKEYLAKAMRYFKERNDSVRFVFFSDDPDWCRDNFGAEAMVMQRSFSNIHSHSDFMLLSSFRGLIISNSTFGWWAGKFAEYERSAVVVAPKKWVIAQSDSDERHRIPDTWVQL